MAEQNLQVMMQEAHVARQRGDRAAETAVLDKALAAFPGDPLALNARGVRALADSDAALAARLFAAAAEADPGEQALWLNLASAHRLQGDDAAEQAALERLLAIDLRHLMGQWRMAELHERRGNLGLATRHWQNVFAMAPSNEELPPAYAARLDAARAFVRAQAQDFSDHIEKGLAAHRQALGPSATRRFDAAFDFIVGRRKGFFSNECSGFHFPFLPADEYFERHHFPWMPDVEARWREIRSELEGLIADPGDAIRPYVRMEKGTPESKWTALDNRLDWSACFLWEYGVPNQPVLDRCPVTAATLSALPRSNIPGRAPSAFFSMLKPHTRIPPHTGVTNTRAIIHLPLIVPPGCAFRVGGETRPWVEGEAFAFDDTIDHEAWNDSDQLRAILIFDVWNPHLTVAEQELLVQFFGQADASGHDPGGRV